MCRTDFCEPIDLATHEFFGRAADVVVTLEDHALMGGYGSIVLEAFGDHRITTPVIRIGWPDVFIEHASSVDYLRQRHGLTAERIIQQVHIATSFGNAAASHLGPVKPAMATVA